MPQKDVAIGNVLCCSCFGNGGYSLRLLICFIGILDLTMSYMHWLSTGIFSDKSTYEAVENAFVTIYVSKNFLETAKNLLNLAIDSNIGDLAALEFIVGALVAKGDISTSTVSSHLSCFK